MALVLVATSACHHSVRPTAADEPVLLTESDSAMVFSPNTSIGWFDYRSDGTTRGDSTVRIASVGMWALEGGDWDRGVRLVRAAFTRGLPDVNFYKDYIAVMLLVRRPADLHAACKTVANRWPADSLDKKACVSDSLLVNEPSGPATRSNHIGLGSHR